METWQPRFTPVDVTSGPIQPALLQAARRAVNEGGSVMLTVHDPGCGSCLPLDHGHQTDTELESYYSYATRGSVGSCT